MIRHLCRLQGIPEKCIIRKGTDAILYQERKSFWEKPEVISKSVILKVQCAAERSGRHAQTDCWAPIRISESLSLDD